MPKKYVEQVGDDGFKKAPIGAGPYKFVSFKPGVELVLEAFEQLLAQGPGGEDASCFRVIPDESTRLAALKRGEVDIAYSITGPLAEELKRTPGLTLVPTYFTFTTWLFFPEQWDPKSPWHDRRVRLAANLAIDRAGINSAVYLGLSKLTHTIIPQGFEYFWAPPPYAFDAKGGQAAPGRGGLSERLRRGRSHRRHDLRRGHRRAGRQLPAAGRHPGQPPADGAGRLLQGVRREEAARGDLQRQRRARQCPHAPRGVRGEGRPLCLRHAIPTSTGSSPSRPTR